MYSVNLVDDDIKKNRVGNECRDTSNQTEVL